MLYSCVATPAIRVYIEKEVVFTDISSPNTIISNIIDLMKPIDDWAEIAFSGRQNAENEQCDTLKKLLHKLNYHH